MPCTAWALYLGLKERFGAENVFLENSTLHGGMQWLGEIRSHVAAVGAFIVLIGPNWMQSLTAHQQCGDVDWVAKEIDLALRSRPHVTVIPLLVDAAETPKSGELPPSLRTLPDCHAERLSHNNLLDDIQCLADRLSMLQVGAAGTTTTDEPEPESAPMEANGQAHEPDAAGGQAPSPPVLPVEDDHYQMLVDEAAYLVVFLGAGANADDHEGPWRQGTMLPDDIDLANYLAGRTSLMYCAISARSGRSDFSLTLRPPANWPRPK